jgi:hypothetical protein
MNQPYAAARVLGTPLMIAPAKLEVILGVAPRLAGAPSSRAPAAPLGGEALRTPIQAPRAAR